MGRNRFIAWLSRLLGSAKPVILGVPVAPLELPAWAVWSKAPSRPRPNTLPAQLAVTARLNVPVGRKAATAHAKPKPVAKAVVKRASIARSVHLQARHGVKPGRQMVSNIVALPVAQRAPAHAFETAAAAA